MAAPPSGFSLHACARFAGMNRSTLKRAIEAGRLAARRSARGRYKVEPRELVRFIKQQQVAVAAAGNHSFQDSSK